jgi:hypothetical protein
MISGSYPLRANSRRARNAHDSLSIHDHVIIGSPASGRSSYFSFKEGGAISRRLDESGTSSSMESTGNNPVILVYEYDNFRFTANGAVKSESAARSSLEESL